MRVVADLVGRTLHDLNELDVPYALAIEGIDLVFTNASRAHAAAILRNAFELEEAKRIAINDKKADREADTFQDNEGLQDA